ncbi:uncharacterized protein LOC107692846 [Sinocyclocheilus anshuiensis]|uniref:uncharacterized protein LOC107692846 n=1 Tax=Sinocyclocheilus anshuiensis TaxID=1608454 RepID=UPI0007B84A6C|nr:PREDICTED: uncharacterized protein LOC107692846 [Sinocyclocheilus anshuiensis]XP_016347543.1 PREDICTED: uncharacterized protein LOC107692846 [Sinocyclocheilus anshuiensis]
MKLILRWIFCFSLGFVADCQEKRYGLKGSSIQLSISPRNRSHLQEPVWRRFNRKELLANSMGVPTKYRKRMSFNVSDWSLTIHDLQENDSGQYEALSNFEEDILTAFTLTVENTVSQPVIKVSQYDLNSSACQATVNCSVDGSWATFDCDQSFCAKTQGNLSSINITIAMDNRDIQCRVNNHVSKNHSQAPKVMCHEKLQSDSRFPRSLITWIIVTIGVGVLLGLFMGFIVVFVKRRKCSKVHPQSSHAVIQQHHETIYCTVEKPAASQTSPGNNIVSNKVETIYDTPSRHTKACQVDSVEVMRDNQEQQQSGHDRTIKVKATVHQAAEPDSEPINTVYCKLGEI